MKTLFWDRKNAREESEQVYGDASLRWAYGTRSGQMLSEAVLSKSFVSQLYGAYQSSSLSRHKIGPFIKKFQIQMDEYEGGPFKNFNEFFIRKFKPGKRLFAQNSDELPAFCEARYLAFEKILPDQHFPVKGTSLTAAGLLGCLPNSPDAKRFEGGPLLLARLCPTDYHRFHYPDDGQLESSYQVHGKLHSVNPLALRYRDEIFETNERRVSILKTQNFGLLAYIEVGALCVGKIIQTDPNKKTFHRGDEKGYFLFGGSTVIVLGEPGKWKPDVDLIENTKMHREVLVRLGERVAVRC